MHLRSHVSRLRLLAEVGRQDYVRDERAVFQFRVAVARVDVRRLDVTRAAQAVGDNRAKWACVLVGDADRRRARRSAHQVAEEAEDHDGRDEEQGEGAPVATESLQQSSRDGRDAVAAHESDLLPASARNASSRFWLPPIVRISAGVPSASSRPYWMRPSRWQRSASSMTWLETIIVVPSAAIRRNDSQNCTRN